MSKVAYLTIDDAPSLEFTKKVDFLENHNIKAIWFCQGNFMEQHPEAVIDAIQRGQSIQNHTYSHPHCSELSLDQCFAEIRSTDAILKELYAQAGVDWQEKYFRFPYFDRGEKNQDPDAAKKIQVYLQKLGYRQPDFEGIHYSFFNEYLATEAIDVFGTYDSKDWGLGHELAEPSYKTLEAILARADQNDPQNGFGLNDGASNEVIVMHDHAGNPENFSLFTGLIEKILGKGLIFQLP